MQSTDMIFRTVYVDRDVDHALLAHAKQLGAPAGAVYRLYLESGLAQLRRGAPLPAADDKSSVMRTADVRIACDELLQSFSFRLNIDQADLNRRVTRLGMLAVRTAIPEF